MLLGLLRGCETPLVNCLQRIASVTEMAVSQSGDHFIRVDEGPSPTYVWLNSLLLYGHVTKALWNSQKTLAWHATQKSTRLPPLCWKETTLGGGGRGSTHKTLVPSKLIDPAAGIWYENGAIMEPCSEGPLAMMSWERCGNAPHLYSPIDWLMSLLFTLGYL